MIKNTKISIKGILTVVGFALLVSVIFLNTINSPSQILKKKMQSVNPIRDILIEVVEPDNESRIMIFFVTQKNTLCVAFFEKSYIGYRFISYHGEVDIDNHLEKDPYGLFLVKNSKNNNDYIILGVINEKVQDVSIVDASVNILQIDTLKFWYSFVNSEKDIEKVSINY